MGYVHGLCYLKRIIYLEARPYLKGSDFHSSYVCYGEGDTYFPDILMLHLFGTVITIFTNC